MTTMSKWRNSLAGGGAGRQKAVAAIVVAIGDLDAVNQTLSDDELRGRTSEYRRRLTDGETLDDLLIEAYATVREAARRRLGLRAYDEQLLAGVVLHFGWAAEMKTGEGKTLASVAPIYLNALSGRGVHVVTANDYLVLRDAAYVAQVLEWLGVSVGAVHPSTIDYQLKRNAYGADVTYGTCTEFGFDYLRDNLATDVSQRVQRDHVYALVDEADSILIDEARTPLVISGPGIADTAALTRAAEVVAQLDVDQDYTVDLEHFVVTLTEHGVERVEETYELDNLYDLTNVTTLHLITQALRARELFVRDRDYLVRDGLVEIVDEFTGRVLEGRRWSDGLHQAVEAKEGVVIQNENTDWATITIQNYFHLYEKLAGMSGTLLSDEEEFAHVYALPIFSVPTHVPSRRVDHSDRLYGTASTKWEAVVEEITTRHAAGQPVLVGTTSVAASDALSSMLRDAGIEHEVLNANHHDREAVIVAQAGRLGAVTVSTNMAGRGVDILLGGQPEALALAEAERIGLVPGTDEAQQQFDRLLLGIRAQCAQDGDRVRTAGGLCVIGTERHDSRRIDNQLRGRAGRQGDSGESLFFLSLEDSLMDAYDHDLTRIAGLTGGLLNVALVAKSAGRLLDRAQLAAESRAQRGREHVYKYDEVVNTQRLIVYALRGKLVANGLSRDEANEQSAGAIERFIEQWCVGYPEEWDRRGLLAGAERLFDWNAVDFDEDLADQLITRVRVELDRLWQSVDARDITGVALSTLDAEWREHLLTLANLREGMDWRAVGRYNPLHTWQLEGYDLFEDLITRVEERTLTGLLRLASAQESNLESEGDHR